ncbi:linker for activation of T-cells family member 2 isoform 2-T2 [Acridotheres tristis]
MAQLELWAAAALMLLGVAVSLCIRCQLSPATKRETQLNEQRSQLESQQRFEVVRSHTIATRRLESTKEPESLSIARKATEELSASHHSDYGEQLPGTGTDTVTHRAAGAGMDLKDHLLPPPAMAGTPSTIPGSRDESRYQNFLTESCLQEENDYVEPISLDNYYNCTLLFQPPCGTSPGKQEKDEDSYSYENVTIGAFRGSDPDDTVDYENRMAIKTWKLQQGQASLTESPDDEPDYINTCPVSHPALLSEQR